jgi:hypothetical protein
MPYKVENRGGDKPWKIILKSTGEVVGSSETEKDANISIWKRSQGENHDEGGAPAGSTASAPAGSSGITVATALKDVSVQYSDNELEEGIAEEMEHTTDRVVAAKIATDHLLEDRDYYRKLKMVMDHASPVKHKEIEKPMDEDIDDDDDLEIEAFSTGTHVSAEGDESTYTDKDLDNMVAKYAEMSDKDPAPVVIGHPQDNSPAYGWVKSAQRVGDKLMLKVHQLNKDFVDALKNHAYKKVSLSIYDDPEGPRIRHLGFLGAMPPAIKGLAPVSYASSEHFKTFTEEFTMAEKIDIEEIKRENSFFKRLFNMFKIDTKQFSEEKTVEKIVDHVETNSVKAQEQGAVPPVPNGDAGIKMAEKTDPGEGTLPAPAQKQEGAEARNDANEEASENETLKKRITALESELATLRATMAKDHSEAKQQSNKLFCEELVKEGRLRPADVEMTVLNLEARAKLDEVRNYSEEQSSYRKYRETLKAMPKVIEFGEFPNVPNMTAGVAVPDAGIDAKAYIEKSTKDKMAATPNISYWDALKSSMAECQEKNPVGYAEYMKGMIPSK